MVCRFDADLRTSNLWYSFLLFTNKIYRCKTTLHNLLSSISYMTKIYPCPEITSVYSILGRYQPLQSSALQDQIPSISTHPPFYIFFTSSVFKELESLTNSYQYLLPQLQLRVQRPNPLVPFSQRLYVSSSHNLSLT